MWGLGRKRITTAQAADVFVAVCAEQGRVSYPRWRASLGAIASSLDANPSDLYRRLDSNAKAQSIYSLHILALALLPVHQIFKGTLAHSLYGQVHNQVISGPLKIAPWVSDFVPSLPDIAQNNIADPLGIVLSDMIERLGIQINLESDGPKAAGMRNHLLMFNMVNHFTSLPSMEFWPQIAKTHKLTLD